MTEREKLRIAIKALADVCDPVAYLNSNLEAGQRVDPVEALKFHNDVRTYHNIASHALFLIGTR